MKSPFYKVYLDEVKKIDITDSVSEFVYEDCIGKDNIIEIKIFDDLALTLLDSPNLITGKKLLVQFGFIAGAVSAIHVGKITDIDTTYTGRTTLTVKALDLGNAMKKSTSSKI